MVHDGTFCPHQSAVCLHSFPGQVWVNIVCACLCVLLGVVVGVLVFKLVPYATMSVPAHASVGCGHPLIGKVVLGSTAMCMCCSNLSGLHRTTGSWTVTACELGLGDGPKCPQISPHLKKVQNGA